MSALLLVVVKYVSVASLSSCSLCLSINSVDEPLHAFIEALLADSRACLDVPSAVSDALQLER